MTYDAYTAEDYQRGPFTVSIVYDTDQPNPRHEYDHPGTHLVTIAGEYDLSDKDSQLSELEIHTEYYGRTARYFYVEDANGERCPVPAAELAEEIEKRTGGVATTKQLHGNSQGEWCTVVIWMTRADILQQISAYRDYYAAIDRNEQPTSAHSQPAQRVTAKDRARARQCLDGDLTELQQYFSGEVYGYQITHTATGKDVDSLYGLYGLDYAREEANNSADSYAEEPEYTPAWEEPYAIAESAH